MTVRRLQPARRRSDALRPAEPLLSAVHDRVSRVCTPTSDDRFTTHNYSALTHVFLRLQVALYIAAVR